MSQAKTGDTVKVHYTGKTKGGNIFATSEQEEPLEFRLGEGTILPGIEKALEGMKVGEKKTVTLTPEEGFGTRQDDLIINVERSQFPDDFEPEVEMEFQVPQPDGSLAYFKILEISGENVKLDGNHPLAGEPLVFNLQLLGIAK